MLKKLLICLCVLAVSCKNPEPTEKTSFADLRSYFTAEAARLEQQHVQVNKAVSRNEVKQSKNGLKPDWSKELSMFTESDINKPAWRDSYSESRHDDTLTYTAKEERLKTRKIEIILNADGTYREINIQNSVSNNLYSSEEDLKYSPETGYRIRKTQDVVILGDHTYLIQGNFIQ